jgi:hypothetical protein
MASSKAEVGRLQRNAAAMSARNAATAGSAATATAEREARGVAEAALSVARAAATAKADLVKDLRARVSASAYAGVPTGTLLAHSITVPGMVFCG